ncbi:MAG: SDR family oxidoreductase [Pseudomonadales bacterium]|nr:SDR family oxidoreductase [Pseudomonadales bacterium]
MSAGVCLITGTTHGIGRVTARELARAGMTLVMACRDLERGRMVQEELTGCTGSGRIELLHCDLASFASIRAASAEFRARHPHLDLLINNAGMMASTAHRSVDGFEMTLATNYLGPYLLTRLLIESMRQRGQARVINVASKVHALGRLDPQLPQPDGRFRGMRAYASSKQALVMFTLSLAERLAGTDVTVNCLHPGVVATNIIPDTRPWLKKAGHIFRRFMFDEERGARTTLHLALAEELAGVTGAYFDEHQKIRPVAAAAQDPAAREILWQRSASLTGMSP